MEITFQKNTLVIVGAVVVLLAGIFLNGVYSRYALKKNALAIEASKMSDRVFSERVKQSNIDDCLKKAYDNYSFMWDTQCDILHLESNCLLGNFKADKLNEEHEKEKNFCLKRYQ